MSSVNPQPNRWAAPDWFVRYFWHLLAVLIFVGASSGMAVLAVKLGVQPTPLPPPVIQGKQGVAGEQGPAGSVVLAREDDDLPNAFSWVEDPEEVKRIAATLAQPVFGATPAGQVAEALPDEVFLWDGYRKLFDGRNPPPQDQNPVGSCVSFGAARAFERSLSSQILQGDGFEFRHVVEEMIYGGSRVEIGGGRIRGDGSVGAWAAKFLTQFGVVPRGVYDRHDLTKYDPNRCRAWGRTGVPDELEPEAKRYPAGDCSQVMNAEQAKKALAQGYGIFICSSQGFTRQRDGNGVSRPQGRWMHCMACDGYKVEGGRLYFHIENSWGPDYHVGPVGWGNPSTAGFWAAGDVVDRMLQQGDSWAVSAVKGFPSRKMDWLVKADMRGGVYVRNTKGRNDVPAISLFFAVPGRPDYAFAW